MSQKAKNHAQSLKIPRTILLTAKLIAFISTKWIVRFAAEYVDGEVEWESYAAEL